MYTTGTGKQVPLAKIAEHLQSFYARNKHFDSPFSLVIGTDSQNYSDRRGDTKIVTAICFLCEGHGGIYFYQAEYVPLLRDIRTKLHTETARSLDVADKLLTVLTENEEYEEMYFTTRFSLNIDAGYEDNEFRNPRTHSKTEALIPELVAWVNAMGYEASVKPEDRSAATVANFVSK